MPKLSEIVERLRDKNEENKLQDRLDRIKQELLRRAAESEAAGNKIDYNKVQELLTIPQYKTMTEFDYIKQSINNYKSARDIASTEYLNETSGLDRNQITQKYVDYTQRASEDTDPLEYYKNRIKAGLAADKIARTGNFWGDLGEITFQGVRNQVAGIEDWVKKRSLDLDDLSLNNMVDSLAMYQIATRNPSQPINESAWAIGGLDKLSQLIAKYPNNEDAQLLFDTIVAGGYSGGYETFEKLSNKVKQFEKDTQYDEFRNKYTIGAKNDDTRQDLKYALTDYNPVERLVLGAGKTVGEMVPTIGASLATGGVLGGVAGVSEAAKDTILTAAGLAPMWSGVYGQTFNEARDAGNDWTRSSLYAFANAALEVGTELIGGESVNSLLFAHTVSTPAGKLAKQIIERGNIKNTLAMGLITRLLDLNAEGFEEVISATVEPLLKEAILQDTSGFDDFAENIFRSYYESILPTLVLGGLGRATSKSEINKYKAMMETAIKESPSLDEKQKGSMLITLDKVTAEAKAGFTENYVEFKKELSKKLDEADLANVDTLVYAIQTAMSDIPDEEKVEKVKQYAKEHGGTFNDSQATSQELKDTATTIKVDYKELEKITKAVEDFKNDTGAEITTVSDINGVQKSIKDLLEKLTGKQVVFADIKSAGSKYYGFMKDDGNIYINSALDTKDTIAAANHELGHYLKQINEGLYKEFLKLTGLDQNSKRVRRTLREYKAKVNSNLTDEEARIEIFGDYVGEVMSMYRNTVEVEKDVSTLWDKLQNAIGKVGNTVLGNQRQGNVSEYNLEGTSYLKGNILQDSEFEKKVLNAFKELKQGEDQTKKAKKKVFKPKETTSQENNSIDNDVKKRIEDKYKSLNKKLVNMKNVKEMIANELGVDYNNETVSKIYNSLKKYGDIDERIELDIGGTDNGKENTKRANRGLKGKESNVSRGLADNGLSGKLLGEREKYPDGQNKSDTVKRLSEFGSKNGFRDSKGRKINKAVAHFFRDTAVINKDGELLVLYHGSPNPQFFVFDKNKLGSNGGTIAPMFDFSAIESFAKKYMEDGGSFYEVYLNIKNPYIYKEGGKNFVELQDEAKSRGMTFIDYMESLGYDGVKINDNFWGAFEPNQIKLTTNTSPTSNPDIRYSQRNEANVTAQGTTIPWALVEWASRSEARNTNGQLDEFYHGSPFAKDDTFDQFKPKYAHNGATLGDGYYLTRSYNRALNYTDMENREDVNADDYVKSFIVNTLNPLDISEPKKVKAQILRNFDSMIEKFNPGFSGGQDVFNKWGRVPYTEDMKEMLEEDSDDDEWFRKFVEYFVPQLAKVNYTNEYGVEETEYIDTREIYKYLGFDSIMDYSDIVIFESNQAKYLDNANPTTDSRFAYSTRKDKNDSVINYANVKDEVEKYAKSLKLDNGYRITVEKGKGLETMRINLQKETYEGKAVNLNDKPMKKYETIKTLDIYNRGVKQTDNKNGVLTSKFDSMDNLMRSIKERTERLFSEGIHKTPTQKKALRKEAELKTAKDVVRKKGTALRWSWKKNRQQQNQIKKYKEKTSRITEAAVDLKLENQFIRKAKSDGINYPKEYSTLFNILRRDGKSINEAYDIVKSYYEKAQVVNNTIDNSIKILRNLRKRSIYNKLPKELKAKIDEYDKIWAGSRQQSDLTLAKRVLNSLTARELLGNVALAKSVKNQIMSMDGYGFENGKGTVSLQTLFKGSEEIAKAFEQGLEDLRKEVAEFQATDMLGERTKRLTDTIIAIQDAVNEETVKQRKSKLKGFKKNYLKTNKTLGSSQMTLKTEIQALMGGNIHSPMMTIHDNLQKAELKKKKAIVEVYRILNDFMTSSSGLNKLMGVEKWSKSLEKSLSNKSDWVDTGMSVPTKSGKNIDLRLPRSMIMSLAMHLQNNDNMLHISGGVVNISTDDEGKITIKPGKGEGVRIPDEELYKAGRIKDAYDAGKTVRLLHEQVEVLADMLTDEEKAFVEAAKEVFKYTSELVNEVSNRLFGYDLATVENYFPIHVWDAGDSAGATLNALIQKKYGQAVAYMLSPGWLQERVTSFNPIYLENIADVLNRTVSNVANFYGYAEALMDNHIILDSVMPDGTELKKSIGGLSSSFMKDYDTLTRFITGQDRHEGSFARSLMALNTLTFNVGTWLTQPMSFFNTLKYFSTEEFIKSINPANNNAKLNQMIRDYFDDIGLDHTQYNDYQVARAFIAMATSSLDYRALGYKIPQLNELFNTSIMDKLNNSIHGISAFDNIAVTAIARMMAYSVSLDQNIKFGSEEYFEVLGDRLSQVLAETQPEFSQVNRANMFRSKNGIMRALSLFGTPANQMLNNVMQSAMQLGYEAREGNIQKSTIENAVKSVVGVALSSAMVALIRALRDSIRGGDDDDIEFRDRYIAQLVIAMLGPTLILDDVAQFAMATANYGGINSYDFSTPETAIMNGVQNLGTKLAQLGKPEISPTKKVVDVVKAAGSITPIDTRSIVRAVEGFMKLVLPDVYSTYALQKDQNAYKKWLESSDTETAKFYKAYSNTRESVLTNKYGYHKADKDKNIKSNLKESRKAALEDVLDNQNDVKKYMNILFGYKD